MKRNLFVLGLSLILGLSSCSKEHSIVKKPFEKTSFASEPGAIDFKMNTIDYVNGQLPYIHYQANQMNGGENGAIIIERASDIYSGQYKPIKGDSIHLSMPIYFSVVTPDPSSIDTFMMRFDFFESLEKVVEIQSGQYQYKQRQFLFETLKQSDWMGYTWNDSQSNLEFGQFGAWKPITNGWYFDNEILEFKHIVFDQETKLIELQGSFQVYLKSLSCGFSMDYHVKEATFTIKI